MNEHDARVIHSFLFDEGFMTFKKVLFGLFVLIVMVNIFRPDPSPVDPEVARKQEEERVAHNKEECKKQGLVYVQRVFEGSKGECVREDDLARIALEDAKKLRDQEIKMTNSKLK